MEQYELLRQVVRVFDDLGVKYFVTGSVASIYFGEPRFTNDIDIVADLSMGHTSAICKAFPLPEFYVSEEAIRDAILTRRQFNIIQSTTGFKVDVIIPPQTAFDRACLSRAVRVHPGPDFEAMLGSPEDIILKKMEAYKEGESDKHLRDITGILKVRGDKVDRAYVHQLAQRLGLAEVWQAILDRLGKQQ